MSATLTISSASLASDGQTLTIGISGATGSLSPTTGITGFSVSGVSGNIVPGTVTASGTTVTIVLGIMIPIGTVVTVSLSITSNLVDSLLNTPSVAGNSNFSVVNNSTQAALPSAFSSILCGWKELPITNNYLNVVALTTGLSDTKTLGRFGSQRISLKQYNGLYIPVVTVFTDGTLPSSFGYSRISGSKAIGFYYVSSSSSSSSSSSNYVFNLIGVNTYNTLSAPYAIDGELILDGTRYATIGGNLCVYIESTVASGAEQYSTYTKTALGIKSILTKPYTNSYNTGLSLGVYVGVTNDINVVSAYSNTATNTVTWNFSSPIVSVGAYANYLYNGSSAVSGTISNGTLITTYSGAFPITGTCTVTSAPGSTFGDGTHTLIIPQSINVGIQASQQQTQQQMF